MSYLLEDSLISLLKDSNCLLMLFLNIADSCYTIFLAMKDIANIACARYK